MQNTSEAYDNRMYFTSDSTKAALPGLVDYREYMGVDDALKYEDSRNDYERGYSDGFEDAKELYLHDGD